MARYLGMEGDRGYRGSRVYFIEMCVCGMSIGYGHKYRYADGVDT